MDCRVIKDLLPMHIEKLTSEQSNELIREHVRSCRECRQTLDCLRSDLPIDNHGGEKDMPDAVPLKLIKRIRRRIRAIATVTASIALAAGILIGLLSSSPVMFMAFMGAVSMIAFAAGIIAGLAVCRRVPPIAKKYRLVANWTFLFSVLASGLLFVLFRGYFNEFIKMAVILVVVLLCNIVFSAALRIYAKRKLPRDGVAGEEPFTNGRLYSVAFVTLLALILVIAVPVTILEKNRVVDNIDLAFESDPDLPGRWVTVDFVNSPEQFAPGSRSFTAPFFLQEITFLEGGEVKIRLDNDKGRTDADAPKPWFSWTRGYVVHKGGDHTASRYLLNEIDGAKYLFLEHKTSDVFYFHQPPNYYVLKKDN
jgi:hypothetical protein